MGIAVGGRFFSVVRGFSYAGANWVPRPIWMDPVGSIDHHVGPSDYGKAPRQMDLWWLVAGKYWIWGCQLPLKIIQLPSLRHLRGPICDFCTRISAYKMSFWMIFSFILWTFLVILSIGGVQFMSTDNVDHVSLLGDRYLWMFCHPSTH